jgi:hypothetical protein
MIGDVGAAVWLRRRGPRFTGFAERRQGYLDGKTWNIPFWTDSVPAGERRGDLSELSVFGVCKNTAFVTSQSESCPQKAVIPLRICADLGQKRVIDVRRSVDFR